MPVVADPTRWCAWCMPEDIYPIFTDKVEKYEKWFWYELVVYNLGVLAHIDSKSVCSLWKQYIKWEYWEILAHKIIHVDVI